MKKNLNRLAKLISVFLFASVTALAQSNNGVFWAKDGNSTIGNGNTLGTFYNGPINIFTNSRWIAEFTTGGGNNLGTNYPGAGLGDGLRIQDQIAPPFGNLDLWTDNSASNSTHIGFGQSGLIQGATTRFEVIGDFNGLWFNARRTSTTVPSTPRILFSINNVNNDLVSNGTEISRFSNNGVNTQLGFMRVGFNPTSIDAARRLEVFDALAAPQFRITQSQGLPGDKFVDFQTTTNGDLAILPFNSTLVPTAANPNIRNTFVGIQTTTPGNTLEINSQATGPTVLNNISPSSTGFSGLRFSDLNSSCVAAPPTAGQGVLSLNSTGDVIWISAPNGLGTCNNANLLASDALTNLNGNIVHFMGQQLNSKVEVGTTCVGPVLPGKFNVYQNSTTLNGTTAIYGLNKDEAVNGIVYGMQGIAIPINPNPLDIRYVGGFFWARASKECFGVYGLADGLASNGTANYGGYFEAQNGAVNVGIKCVAQPQSATNFAAWFEGNILFNGTLSGTNNVLTSDQMFKTNIASLSNASSIIQSLQPKSFYFDTTNAYNMYFDSHKQYGFIAQDVEAILPELIESTTKPAEYDTLGNVVVPSVTYKTMNYNALFGIIVKAMQEEQSKTDSLLDVITAMQAQMNSCCSMNSRTADNNTNQTDVTLSNSESVVLNQNVPNPFAEQTTITYNLPSTTKKAQMIFYDVQGKMIKVVDLNGTGKGQINVFADDLSNGTYTYAMVVDGQVVDTKRMVKTN